MERYAKIMNLNLGSFSFRNSNLNRKILYNAPYWGANDEEFVARIIGPLEELSVNDTIRFISSYPNSSLIKNYMKLIEVANRDLEGHFFWILQELEKIESKPIVDFLINRSIAVVRNDKIDIYMHKLHGNLVKVQSMNEDQMDGLISAIDEKILNETAASLFSGMLPKFKKFGADNNRLRRITLHILNSRDLFKGWITGDGIATAYADDTEIMDKFLQMSKMDYENNKRVMEGVLNAKTKLINGNAFVDLFLPKILSTEKNNFQLITNVTNVVMRSQYRKAELLKFLQTLDFNKLNDTWTIGEHFLIETNPTAFQQRCILIFMRGIGRDNNSKTIVSEMNSWLAKVDPETKALFEPVFELSKTLDRYTSLSSQPIYKSAEETLYQKMKQEELNSRSGAGTLIQNPCIKQAKTKISTRI